MLGIEEDESRRSSQEKMLGEAAEDDAQKYSVRVEVI